MFRFAVVVIVLINVCGSFKVSKHDVNYVETMRVADKLTHKGPHSQYKNLQTSNMNNFQVPFMGDIINRAEKLLLSKELNDPFSNVDEDCLNSTKLFLEALSLKQQWAIQMVDAMGKPGSDITSFHFKWAGSWEQCKAVSAVTIPTNVTASEHAFDGKYCIAQVPIELYGIPASVDIGICFPDTCSDANCWSLTYTLLGLLPTTNHTFPTGIMCQENSLELSDKAIAVIVVCSIFVAVIVMATLYDVIIRVFLTGSQTTNKVTPKAPDTKYGTSNDVSHHVTSETTTLITGEDSYQRNMISHNEHDVKKIANGVTGNVSEDKTPAYKPGMLGMVLLSFSAITNASKILNTNQPSGTLTNVNGVRFISMMWVILGHTYVFSLQYGGMLGRVLLSFSAITNASKILNTNQPSGTLTNVNGVRFISMMWVILGHTYAFGLTYGDNTLEFLNKMYKRFSFQAIENETVAVDTFFVLSGLLVAYLALREMKKRGGPRRFNWLMFYFHRFWRLTPPYMLFLMLYVPTFKYWGDGPFWPQNGIEVDECKDTWWTNLLYINNIVKDDKMCMGWSWYLANDMQFYILSPLMLVPLFYSPIAGGLMCFAFVLTNFIAAGVISHDNKLSSNLLFGGGDSMGKIYVKPWTRVGPYAVGIFTGYLLYKADGKFKMPKIVNIIGWLGATAVALLVLYGLYSSDGVPTQGVETSAFYNATSRTAWGLAVAWVVFACAVGYGGPVNTLLSWKGIIPLSRLTYCAYLVHPVVMYAYYMSRRTLIHFYDFEMIYIFCGNLCLSYALAFIVSLAFESPMMGLEKVLLRRDKNS